MINSLKQIPYLATALYKNDSSLYTNLNPGTYNLSLGQGITLDILVVNS